MPYVKISLSGKYYDKLLDMSAKSKLSIQDYIRKMIFQEHNIFTPGEAAERARKKYSVGDRFTLPDIYGDEWTLERGPSGVFGKRFFNYVKENPTSGIAFDKLDNITRRARYIIMEEK